MACMEPPITLEQQVLMMKKYVLFRQRKRMKEFLSYAGYFRASRFGKYLLSQAGAVGRKLKQDELFQLYEFDVNLRRVLNFYCNRVEVKFKSAMSNACAIDSNDGAFYLDEKYYTPSKSERDAKRRKGNIKHFELHFFPDIKKKESDLRKNVIKYPELKEYRNGGSKHHSKLPVWVTFSYVEFGTITMMYSYLRGDLRKKVLEYSFGRNRYTKKDTESVDTWLDAVRNLRNYCAHNSMVVGINSSVVLVDAQEQTTVLVKDNDLFSRLYALKKLLPKEDTKRLKNDIIKLIKKTPIDVYLFSILPQDWEDLYDKIKPF